MKILSLELENFRALKNIKIDFDGHNTDIFGDNGTGKTTIANAVSWLLCNQPSTEEKDFTPKTQGAHDLHHKATLTVAKDTGEQISFCKDFYELWTKKRGATTAEFSGHTVDHYVNGVPTKKKDYDAAVEAAAGCTLEQIRMLTIHGYFPATMKADARRAVIFELSTNITDDEVIETNGLQELQEILKRPGAESGETYTIDEYRKVATAQRGKLNKDLDIIPARIDEASKGLAETGRSDMAYLEAKLKEAENAEAVAVRVLEETKRSKWQDVKRAALAGLQVELEQKRAAFTANLNEQKNGILDAIRECTMRRDADSSEAMNCAAELRRSQEHKAELERKRQTLLDEYAAVQAETWDEHREVCPTCGQALPPEKVQELRDNFNLDKSNRKADINKRGRACSKATIESAEQHIKEVEQDLATATKNAEQGTKELDILKQNPILTNPPKFEDSEECKDVMARIQEIKAKPDDDAPDSQQIQMTEQALETAKAHVKELQEQLARIKHNKEVQERIEELKSEQKEKSGQLERIEHGLSLCDKFTRAKARMITDSINSHFKTVRWQLFRNQINGGLEQVCNPMTQNAAGEWVEYRSSNTAAQVNAGLEIIDVLNAHYGTNLPVIIDRAESVCKVHPIKEQLVRLIVSAADETLRIKVKAEA